MKKFFDSKSKLEGCRENLSKEKDSKWYKKVAIAILTGTITLGSIENVYAQEHYSSGAVEQQEVAGDPNEPDIISQMFFAATAEGMEWLKTNPGREWLKTEAGRIFLEKEYSCGWLMSKDGQGWLKGTDGQSWLKEKEENSVKMIKEKDGSLKWVASYKTSKGIESSTWKECLIVTPTKPENGTYNNSKQYNEERRER